MADANEDQMQDPLDLIQKFEELFDIPKNTIRCDQICSQCGETVDGDLEDDSVLHIGHSPGTFQQ